MSHSARALREAMGISQTELGRRVQLSQGALSHIERGTRRPSLDAAIRLARVFGLTVEQLFAELGPRHLEGKASD
jgi:putative transcriptional regulator